MDFLLPGRWEIDAPEMAMPVLGDCFEDEAGGDAARNSSLEQVLRLQVQRHAVGDPRQSRVAIRPTLFAEGAASYVPHPCLHGADGLPPHRFEPSVGRARPGRTDSLVQ